MFFRRLGGHPAAGLSVVAGFFRAARGNGACEFSLYHRCDSSVLPDGARESRRTKKPADAQRPYLCAVAICLDQPGRPKPSAPVSADGWEHLEGVFPEIAGNIPKGSMMKILRVPFLAAAIVAGVCGLGTVAMAQQTEVKLGYALAENSHYGAGAKAWADYVEKETNGKYKFRMFPSSGLGGEREVVEGLPLGTVEATIVSTGTLSNFVPAVGATDIPFLFRDLQHARSVLDGPIGQNVLVQFDARGMVALAWGEQGFRHITNNKHPITKPEDLAGLKLRTMENPVHITAFKTLGAAPTPMAWPEVIGALQQGTIDGQENPLSVIVSAKLNEVQKYLTLTGHVYSPAMILMSKKFYDGLSDDEKKIFRDGAAKGRDAMRAYVDNVEKTGVETLKTAGMQVNELSAEQKEGFQKALKSAYDQYYEKYGKDLIDSIIAAK